MPGGGDGLARASSSERDLFVAGIALYAGEGRKTDGGVGFANSDPRMIALFLPWLRTFFDGRRDAAAAPAVPARGPRPRRGERVLVLMSPAIPIEQFASAVPSGR